MALAFIEREIETELRRLDADLRRESPRPDLIEEPEIVIAHRDRGLGARDRFAELREDQPAATRGDGGTRCECVIGVLARHERPRRPLHECAPKSEIVEPPASRRGQQDRTSERHGRLSSLNGAGTTLLIPGERMLAKERPHQTGGVNVITQSPDYPLRDRFAAGPLMPSALDGVEHDGRVPGALSVAVTVHGHT